MVIDPDYKIDARPLKYAPPASAIAAFMQLPGYLMTPLAAATAYMKDWRADRSRAAAGRELAERAKP